MQGMGLQRSAALSAIRGQVAVSAVAVEAGPPKPSAAPGEAPTIEELGVSQAGVDGMLSLVEKLFDAQPVESGVWSGGI